MQETESDDTMQRLKGQEDTLIDTTTSGQIILNSQIQFQSLDPMSSKKLSISIDIDDATKRSHESQNGVEFKILCLDLKSFPAYVQFLLCCSAVFVFYLIYGYCQVSS